MEVAHDPMGSPVRRLRRRALAAVAGAGIVVGSMGFAVSPAAALASTCTGYVGLRNGNGETWSRPAINRSTNCELRPNVAGAPVLILQQTLIQCYNQTISEWGYGAQTVRAVKNVQAFHGVSQDGIYGPVTGARMMWYGKKQLKKGGYVSGCDWF